METVKKYLPPIACSFLGLELMRFAGADPLSLPFFTGQLLMTVGTVLWLVASGA